MPKRSCLCILDLHVSHVGGEVQKNILSILLLAPASVGEQYCLMSPERLVASQEWVILERMHAQTGTAPDLNLMQVVDFICLMHGKFLIELHELWLV